MRGWRMRATCGSGSDPGLRIGAAHARRGGRAPDPMTMPASMSADRHDGRCAAAYRPASGQTSAIIGTPTSSTMQESGRPSRQ